jgi:hypothetical protein
MPHIPAYRVAHAARKAYSNSLSPLSWPEWLEQQKQAGKFWGA